MREAALERLETLKRQRRAVILAHNYQRPEIQDAADHVGDSLELSRIAAQASNPVIVFCGVRFMAETASILCPEKTILLPVPEAGCTLADWATAEAVRERKQQCPDAVVVAYVNSSPEVKAEADVCCTSANVLDVIRAVAPGRRILLVPDRCLGQYAAAQTGRQMLLWHGVCPTHAALSSEDLRLAKAQHPDARVMVHPECRPDAIRLADHVAGTSGMIAFARAQPPGTAFIVGTETGLLHRLRSVRPDQQFYPAAAHLICPMMKLTTLDDVVRVLERMEPVVYVSEPIRVRARRALEAMWSRTSPAAAVSSTA